MGLENSSPLFLWKILSGIRSSGKSGSTGKSGKSNSGKLDGIAWKI